jgi:hypothetical protein
MAILYSGLEPSEQSVLIDKDPIELSLPPRVRGKIAKYGVNCTNLPSHSTNDEGLDLKSQPPGWFHHMWRRASSGSQLGLRSGELLSITRVPTATSP